VAAVSWWIVVAQLTLTEQVPAEPARVREFYVDLHNIKLVHPLVTSVRSISRSETAGGYVQKYRVRDRIPLGPIVVHTSYVAVLHVPVAGDVVTETRQFPSVRLHGKVTFEGIDGGTRVIERIRIQAPRPLAGLTHREAVKAHIAMLAGIRRQFE
jgi:hypothetical protein